jgi:hypothetical protein
MPKIKNWDKVSDKPRWKNTASNPIEGDYVEVEVVELRNGRYLARKLNVKEGAGSVNQLNIGKSSTKERAKDKAIRYMKKHPMPN